jgi:hypothetical protein
MKALLLITALLVATGWADEDASIEDFVGGAYPSGRFAVVLDKDTAVVTGEGLITRDRNIFITPRGAYGSDRNIYYGKTGITAQDGDVFYGTTGMKYSSGSFFSGSAGSTYVVSGNTGKYGDFFDAFTSSRTK